MSSVQAQCISHIILQMRQQGMWMWDKTTVWTCHSTLFHIYQHYRWQCTWKLELAKTAPPYDWASCAWRWTSTASDSGSLGHSWIGCGTCSQRRDHCLSWGQDMWSQTALPWTLSTYQAPTKTSLFGALSTADSLLRTSNCTVDDEIWS